MLLIIEYLIYVLDSYILYIGKWLPVRCTGRTTCNSIMHSDSLIPFIHFVISGNPLLLAHVIQF